MTRRGRRGAQARQRPFEGLREQLDAVARETDPRLRRMVDHLEGRPCGRPGCWRCARREGE